MKPDPLGVPRNAFQVYLFVVCVLNGVFLAIGVPVSTSLAHSLPDWAEHGFGALLALGSLAVLVGMYWQGAANTGLLIKRVGYVGLSAAGFIYAIALAATFDIGSLFAGSLTAGFAALCARQAVVINHAVARTIRASGDSDAP